MMFSRLLYAGVLCSSFAFIGCGGGSGSAPQEVAEPTPEQEKNYMMESMEKQLQNMPPEQAEKMRKQMMKNMEQTGTKPEEGEEEASEEKKGS